MVQLPSIHLQYSGTQHRAKGSVEREFTSIPESALRDELPKGHDLLDATRGTSHIRYSRKPVGRSTLVRARYWYYSSTCMPCVQACRYRGGMRESYLVYLGLQPGLSWIPSASISHSFQNHPDPQVWTGFVNSSNKFRSDR